MQLQYPDPFSVSEESIMMALASGAIEGHVFLDPEYYQVPGKMDEETVQEFPWIGSAEEAG